MDIQLNFKEQDFREIYKDSYKKLIQDHQSNFRSSRKISLVLITISVFFFILVIFHFDWIYYGLFFLFLALLIVLIKLTFNHLTHRVIRKNKKKVEEWISKTKKINGIKYTYDSLEIRYFEEDKLEKTLFWKNAVQWIENEKYLYIIFKPKTDAILLPYSMIDSNQIEAFKTEMKKRIK